MDIATRELVYMENKYLTRYTARQHKFVSDLMKRITYADMSQEDLNLTQKDKYILSAVCEEDEGLIIPEIETHAKRE